MRRILPLAIVGLVTLSGCGLDPLKVTNDSGASGGGGGGDDTGAVMVGDLRISPGTLDFGSQALSTPAELTLVVEHTGDEPVVFRRTQLSGDDAFEITQQTELPVEMAGGDEVAITVAFTPDESIDYSGELSLDLASLDEPFLVPILGFGEGAGGDGGDGSDGGAGGDGGSGDDGGSGPSMGVSPSSVSFGPVDVGSSGIEEVRLTNNFGEDVLLQDIAMTPSEFGWVRGGDINLPQIFSAGASKSLPLEFVPSSIQPYTGTATLELRLADDSIVYQDISLSGEGTEPPCSICAPIMNVVTNKTPNEMDLAEYIGCEATDNVTVSNSGDQDLTLSSIYVTNDAIQTCGTLSISGSTSATVPPGGSTAFTVKYTATESCIEVGVPELDANMVHILNNTANSDYTIAVNATALCLF
jgi:hypothetical protein